MYKIALPQFEKSFKLSFSLLGFGALLLSLTACASEPVSTSAPVRTQIQQNNPYRVTPSAPFTPPELHGQKLVRVALLLPINASNASVKEEALTMAAAARLSLTENGDGKTVMFTEDSGATPEEAVAAMRSALNQGADFVLGPLFASGISAIAPYARANDATVFSFSTDTSEAGRGIYVLSFLPEDEATRIVSYAGAHGIKRLVLLLPNGRYGDRIFEAANEAARRANIQVVGTERYDNSSSTLTSATDAARRAATLSTGGPRGQTAILMPERGAMLRNLVQTLSLNGASTSRVRYLGTSLWNEPTTLAESRLLGGWFVTTDISTRAPFEARLREESNRRPTRLAGMGYDAMTIIARLARGGDKSQITKRALENPNGFQGVDGRFRFHDGVAARALAISEVAASGGRVIEPAPQGF